MTQDILIHGVWIRSIGGKVELLVELDDGWHLCATEPLDGAFGHIVEPNGIRQSPKDYLRESNARHDEEREARFAAMFQEMFSAIDSCKDVPQQLIDAFEKIAAKGGGALARVEAAARRQLMQDMHDDLENCLREGKNPVLLLVVWRDVIAALQDRGQEVEK